MMQHIRNILTNEIHIGKYIFNKQNNKTGKVKPEDQWIKLTTPRIIDDIDFFAARNRLQYNHPLVTAPRIVNSSILLTGLLYCSQCNSHLTIKTGKSGAYRYYRCSKRADANHNTCRGWSMRMEKLDEIVLNIILDRTLAPERLDELLTSLIEHDTDSQRQQIERNKNLKNDKCKLEKQLNAIWQKISTEELHLDSSVKSQVNRLQTEFEIVNCSITHLDQQKNTPLNLLPSAQKHNFLSTLRAKLTTKGQSKFKKAYLRSLVSRIEVSENLIKISGSTASLAKLIGDFNKTGNIVPNFDGIWLPRQDSNL